MLIRSHANNITHTSPPTVSQITKPAVFTLIFYLYMCTDVRYWGGRVPINLWSPTPQIYCGWFLSLLRMLWIQQHGLKTTKDYLTM